MTALYYETTDELKHHGVKGMKWGVRKKEKERMQKKEFGLSKKEVKFKVKTAKKVDAANNDLLFSTSTGKNWDKVREANKKAVKNDKKIKSLRDEYDDLNWRAIFAEDGSTKQEVYRALADEKSDAIDRRTREIGKRYTDAYSEALLKDIGYKRDIETGKRMLKAYGIENSFGKY